MVVVLTALPVACRRTQTKHKWNTCSLPSPSMTRPALFSISASGKHSVRLSHFLTGTNAVNRPPTLSNGFPKALSDPMTWTSFVNGDILLLFVSCDTIASRMPSNEVDNGTMRWYMLWIWSLPRLVTHMVDRLLWYQTHLLRSLNEHGLGCQMIGNLLLTPQEVVAISS